MAQTLFERLVYGKPKPEETVYNPLQARVGNRFKIDTIEWRANSPYPLRGLAEYCRKGRKDRKFVDYIFDEFRLRVMPEDTKGPFKFSCYLLKDDGREGWIEELNDSLRDRSGIFNINKGDVEHQYFRFLAEGEKVAGSPHLAEVRDLRDENFDGKVQEDEISVTEIEYFDFYREVTDVADQKDYEYLFVDHDLNSRTFQFWVGNKVLPDRVTCL